jgi:hypothetical protein
MDEVEVLFPDAFGADTSHAQARELGKSAIPFPDPFDATDSSLAKLRDEIRTMSADGKTMHVKHAHGESLCVCSSPNCGCPSKSSGAKSAIFSKHGTLRNSQRETNYDDDSDLSNCGI